MENLTYFRFLSSSHILPCPASIFPSNIKLQRWSLFDALLSYKQNAQKPPATLVFTNTDIKQFSATMQCWWFWISMPQHKSHFHLKVFRGECHQYCLYIYNEESTDHPFWIGPRFTKNGLCWFDPVQDLTFYLVPIRFGTRFLKLFGSGPWFPVYN